MLNATNLTLHYGGSQILHGLDIAARPGAVTCVMGNNGVGKTSLMQLLAGRHPRSGGRIEVDGRELGRVTAQQMARLGVGYVPQGRAIFPMLTVRENMQTGFACPAPSAASPTRPSTASRCWPKWRIVAAATCRAASSSSLPSPAP